jgi:hypothetical protein
VPRDKDIRAIPHSIYLLIDLLDFLRPADPIAVFDLITNALLNGGARHGYQFESLATGRFIEIVGIYLADHRGIFTDTERREKLIACLDMFVLAGWPTARRLLYRLPSCSRASRHSSQQIAKSRIVIHAN